MSAQLTLGTGLLSGRTSPTRARRVVAAALDAGITRFDTARAYGDGETEHLLGSVLRRHPEVEIVTKAGLGPLSRRAVSALRWRAASPVVGLLPTAPSHRAAVPGDEEADPDDGARFDERTLRTSIDASRRALRRERLDLVLLHEFDRGPLAPAAVDLMDTLVAEGAIGAWGVGTGRPALRRLQEDRIRLGAVVQTTGGPLLPAAPVPVGAVLSVHSVLGPSGALLNAFLGWLEGSPFRGLWESAVGPTTARRTAGTELLRLAVSDPRTASVLVSSRDPDALVRTVAAARHGADDERLSLLAPLLSSFAERAAP